MIRRYSWQDVVAAKEFDGVWIRWEDVEKAFKAGYIAGLPPEAAGNYKKSWEYYCKAQNEAWQAREGK